MQMPCGHVDAVTRTLLSRIATVMAPIFPRIEKIVFDARGYRAMHRLSLNTTTVAGPWDSTKGQNATAPARSKTIITMSRGDTVQGRWVLMVVV
jgi:hypothetical protein